MCIKIDNLSANKQFLDNIMGGKQDVNDIHMITTMDQGEINGKQYNTLPWEKGEKCISCPQDWFQWKAKYKCTLPLKYYDTNNYTTDKIQQSKSAGDSILYMPRKDWDQTLRPFEGPAYRQINPTIGVNPEIIVINGDENDNKFRFKNNGDQIVENSGYVYRNAYVCKKNQKPLENVWKDISENYCTLENNVIPRFQAAVGADIQELNPCKTNKFLCKFDTNFNTNGVSNCLTALDDQTSKISIVDNLGNDVKNVVYGTQNISKTQNHKPKCYKNCDQNYQKISKKLLDPPAFMAL